MPFADGAQVNGGIQEMKKTALCSVFVLMLTVAVFAAGPVKPYEFPTPERGPGQKSMIGFRVAPIKNVRIAVIGVGARGGAAMRRFASVPDKATLKAAADLWPEKLEKMEKHLKSINYPHKVDYYTGADDWKKICERNDIDLVYVATPGNLHVPIAIYAMKNGKHVVTEVTLTHSIEKAWELIDAAEKYQKHCMMLENCNYSDYAMAVMNMIKKGVFGETIHAEAGYIHNMESYKFRNAKDNWRKLRKPSQTRPLGGNTYPTHALGPVAHWMNLNRGDRMVTLNAIATNDFTLKEAVKEHLGEDSEFAKGYYWPDMNLTMIRTFKGKTILLYYATALRRPYSRAYELNATKGYTAYSENRQTSPIFAFAPKYHDYLRPNQCKALVGRYRHPIYKKFQAEAKKFGGHGGMDTVMDFRLLYCLNNGLPLDMDVYDGATWSSIIEASKKSVELGGAPVALPDFTRGDWDKRKCTQYYYIDKDGNEKAY